MFQKIEDMPAMLRSALPRRVLEHYRVAFNRTWEKLAAGDEPAERSRLAARAHAAAQLAVEAEFEKDDEGRWRRRPVGEEVSRRDDVDPDPGVG